MNQCPSLILFNLIKYKLSKAPPHSESTSSDTIEAQPNCETTTTTGYISYKSIAEAPSNEGLNQSQNSPIKSTRQQQQPFYLQPSQTVSPTAESPKPTTQATTGSQKFTSVQDRIHQFQSQLNRSNQKTPNTSISTESNSTSSSPRVVKILNSDNTRKTSPPINQQQRQDVTSIAKNAAFQKNLNNIKEAMSPKLNKPTDFIVNKASIPVHYQTSPVTPYQRNQQQNKSPAENVGTNHNSNTINNSTTIQINTYASQPANNSTRITLEQQQQLAVMAKKRVDTQQQQHHISSPGYEMVTSDQEEEVAVTSDGSAQRDQQQMQQPQKNLRSQRMQERNIRHGGFQVILKEQKK